MNTKTLAHISDLHIGRSWMNDLRTQAICEALSHERPDCVVITGDVTHRGRREELERFEAMVEPLRQVCRVFVVPGNHDRVGEDAGATLMDGARIRVEAEEGLVVVRVDSTAPHNRDAWRSHGELTASLVEEIELALAAAPAGALRVVALHHHVLPMAEETWAEWLSAKLGLPHASELELGPELVFRTIGRCDLILHGHRHVPGGRVVRSPEGERLRIYNAGSSAEHGAALMFKHWDGRLVAAPRWMRFLPPAAASFPLDQPRVAFSESRGGPRASATAA